MKNGSVNLLEVENPTVTYGDYIDFHMNWEFDDDTEIEKNVPYTYELPACNVYLKKQQVILLMDLR